MKVLTKEEADAHYATTIRGGIIGGAVGLGAGLASAVIFHYRFPFFRGLTLPFKTFYVTSAGTFAAIVYADRYSRSFEQQRTGESALLQRKADALAKQRALQTPYERAVTWGRENRYSIVGASWVASMSGSLWWAWRNKYLTKSQKLVQARVYAQGLTLLVLIASAAFEVADARNQKRIGEEMVPDPSDPEGKRMVARKTLMHHEHYKGEDLWKDMIAAEERKINERKQLHKE